MALESAPRSVTARLGLASSVAQLGRRAEARALAEEVLRVDAANRDAQKIIMQLKLE